MAHPVPWFSLGNFDHFPPKIAKILGFKMPKMWKRHQFKDIIFWYHCRTVQVIFLNLEWVVLSQKECEDPRRCHINPEILKNFTQHIDWNLKKTCVFFSPFVFFFKCTDLGQDIETNARHCPSNPVKGLRIEDKFGRILTYNVKPIRLFIFCYSHNLGRGFKIFKYFFIFTTLFWAKMNPIWLEFFRWVGSTTN